MTAPALPPVPLWLSLLWGMAESTFFFIIPDVALGWASLGSARAGIRSALAIVAGSLLGGVAMYLAALVWPGPMLHAVAAVPFVTRAMFTTVEAAYLRSGALALLEGPSSGIPYKVYAVLAPAHIDIRRFALISIPARLERLALSWVVFSVGGRVLRPVLVRHQRATAVAFGVIWCAIYAYYWSRP